MKDIDILNEDYVGGSDELKLKKVFESKIEIYEILDDWIGCGVSGEKIQNIYPQAELDKTYLIKKDGDFHLE